MARKKAVTVTEVKVKGEKESNNSQNSFTTSSIIMALIGIILLFLPEEINKLIGYLIGGALLFAGIITIIKYCKDQIKISSLNLISGILYAILGLIIVLNPLSIMKFATLVFGIYLVVNGALKMYSGYISKDIDSNMWKVLLISGTIIVVFGLVLIINPFSGLIITKVAGAFLLVVAIYDIINQIVFNK